MPLYKVRFSTNEIIDEIILKLHNNDLLVATNTLRIYYNVDNPIIISMVQIDSIDMKSQLINDSNGGSEATRTDPYAIVTFCTGLIGFMFLPLLFVPICFVFSILSYYRLKENKRLKGNGLRIVGAIINAINILYLFYTFKVGSFNF